MTATATSIDSLSSEFRRYITERAGNYDSYTASDLFEDIPSKLHGSEDAMMSFLRGNEALGVEAREVMHLNSRFNGGTDVPDNLMLGPESLNGDISSANMTAWDINEVMDANAKAVDVILEAEPDVLVQAWEGLSYAATGAAATTETATVIAEAESALPVTDVLPDLGDVVVESGPIAEAGVGELLGEALVDGVVPAIFAYKVGSYVSDNCDAQDVDPTAAGWAAAGGTVLLYANPITGPIAWTATGVYSAWKLAQLGCKLYQKFA